MNAPALLTMADVTPEAHRWLWPGRIPLGTLTILDGDPGLGKSLVTIDLAARVSRGSNMPDGSVSDLGAAADVIMVFCEDDPGATVRPRLDVAGADVTRIHQLRGTQKPDRNGVRPLTLADVETIDQALTQTDARLVTVDPWAAYIGGRDSRSDEKMRELLTPLADIARSRSAAVVIVRHLRKAAGPAAMSGAGSVGIAGAARSVLLVGADPADPEASRVLAVSKGNLSARAESLKFTIEAVPVDLRDAEGVTRRVEIPRVVWGGTTDTKADDLVAAARAETTDATKRNDVEAWLLETLTDSPIDADELQRAAVNGGHKLRTLERARAKLRKAGKIWSHKEGGLFGSWWWGLGEEPPTAWLADRARWTAKQ